MTFVINGIKQENEIKRPLEIVIVADSSLLVRKLCEDHNILILSLKEYADDQTKFGDVYFTIRMNFQEIAVITKYTDIQEAANFFVAVGWDIQSINSYSHPISPAKSSEIVSKAKDTVVHQTTQREEVQRQLEEQEKRVYTDKRLESAKRVIEKIFIKVDETIKRSQGQISSQELKRITGLTEDLKKLRMGTNFEKIRDNIQAIIAWIEEKDERYYASIQNAADTIDSQSQVTNVDVDREMEKLENIRILKSLRAKISIKDQDYAIFGPIAMFRKFLQKDIIAKLTDIPALLNMAYDVIEFVLLIVICLFGVYALADEVYLFSSNQFGLEYMLMSVGLRGMVIFAARYFRNKNIGRLLLIIALAILLHYLLMRAVTTNFAL